jgi:hypothetical protein
MTNYDPLEGDVTFHDMGILATVTPNDPIKKNPWLSATVKNVRFITKINLVYYRPTKIADEFRNLMLTAN